MPAERAPERAAGFGAIVERPFRPAEAPGQRDRAGHVGQGPALQDRRRVLVAAGRFDRSADRDQRVGQRREQPRHHGLELHVRDDVAQPVRRTGLLLDLVQQLERLQEVAELVDQQADGDRRVMRHVHALEERRHPDAHAVGRSRVGVLLDADVGAHQAGRVGRDHGQDLVGGGIEHRPDVRRVVHGRPPTRTPMPSSSLRKPSAAGRSMARSCAK